MTQNEFTREAALLDDEGRLSRAGWARQLLLRYERSLIAAPLRRIKECDYYCVLGAHFGIALTIADNGYMGMLSATLIDLDSAKTTTHTETVLFPMGRFALPSSSRQGSVRVNHRGTLMDFSVLDNGSRIIKVDMPGFDNGTGLRGALVLSPAPSAESIVTAIPWKKNKNAFYYNQKTPSLDAEGVMRSGKRDFVFMKDEAFAVFDWGRGVWPASDTWYWASASGIVDGKRFAFNAGCGFGDTSQGTENALFVDGKLHKLGSVRFELDPGDYLKPWQLESDDGRLVLDLDPILDRSARMNALIYSSIQHQVFGTFRGTAILDDGTSLSFQGLTGFAEKVKNRW